MDKKRVLFVAEAATLAHVARPLALSAALDPREYDVGFACDPRFRWALAEFKGRYFPLASKSSHSFLAALEQGKPVFDEDTLSRYVRDDLALLSEVRPDVVIGDFRLSLSASARVAGVPYVTISNCYWSPFWRPRYKVPSLPLTRYLPIPLADILFRTARPFAFALHCRPLNSVRRTYGLPSLGTDLRRVYTDADYVLYADVPQLFAGVDLPRNHHFIGAVIWSPPVAAPSWWDTIDKARPIVYVTMGSSGRASLLPGIIESLANVNVAVIAATASRELGGALPGNARVAEYLPGDEAARRSHLVICNGGGPTCHQALAAGVPVIGLPGNLDQFLNMQTIEDAGAGVLLRADRFRGSRLRHNVRTLLATRSYAERARNLSEEIRRHPAEANFVAFLRGLLGGA
jgi:UDP:flavonoid glycosyltransferase YjiC (YdhE family)